MDYADMFADLFGGAPQPDSDGSPELAEEGEGCVRICEDHREMAIDALEARGISSLVAEDGEDTDNRLRGMMEDGPSLTNFDPLLYMQLLILEAAIQLAGGLFAFLEAHGSEVCPLCFLDDIHERYTPGNCEVYNTEEGHSFDRWLYLAADAALDAWKEIGSDDE